MDEHLLKRMELLENRLHEHIEHYAQNNKTLALLAQRMDLFASQFAAHDIKEMQYQNKIDEHLSKMGELIEHIKSIDIESTKKLVEGYKGLLSFKGFILSLAAISAGTAGGNSSFGAYATANGGGAGNATVNDSSLLGGGAGGTGGSTGIIQMKIDAGVAGGTARGGYNPVSANAGTDNDFGGAGGGSAALGEGYTGSPATSNGGTSTNGGNGGNGAYNATATDGSSKGGGGGGSASDNATSYSSGKGGDGYCRVTVF